MKKNLTVTALVLLSMFGWTASSFAQSGEEFIDTRGHPHESQIMFLADKGIVEGYGYGIFRPDIAINRAEFLKILMTAVNGKEEVIGDQSRCFKDFIAQKKWYWIHACLAKKRRIIDGYPDGTFRGDKTVNLAEALKIAMNAWSIPVPQIDVSADLWYLPYFSVAAQRGLFEYFPKNASHEMTRSEMAYLIVTLGEPIKDANTVSSVVVLEDESEPKGPTVNPAVCGNGTEEPGEQCDDGNNEDGDGCSSICVVVEVPVYHGVLRLEKRTVPSPRVSAGAEDVTVFGFDFLAARQDVRVTQLQFRVVSGDPLTADSYSLWVDTDADEEVDTLVKTAVKEGEQIIFDGFDILAPDGQYVRAELHADISQQAENPFQVDFATDNPLFISATDVSDGRELSGIELNNGDCNQEDICWISVLSDGPQVVDILGRGNLYITEDSVPVPVKQLSLGETTGDLMRLNLRTEGESVEIQDIQFSDVPTNISKIYMFKENESNPAASASTVACNIPIQGHFCMDTSIIIGANEEMVISIRAELKSRNQGGKSGQKGALTIDGTLSDVVTAFGLESDKELTVSDGDTSGNGEIFIGVSTPGPNTTITSQEHETYVNRITAIENASPDADGSPVVSGTTEIGSFTFEAGTSQTGNVGYDDVTIKTLVFDVTATNVQFLGGTFKIVNDEETNKAAACTESGITGDITVTCSNIDQLIATTIRAGESVQFNLSGLILESGKAGSTSILQVTLPGLGNPSQTGTITWADGQNTVEWVDIGKTSAQSTRYTQDQ